MISKDTFAAVQSLYDDVEDGYNQRIRRHVQQQMLAHLDDITRELEAIHTACGAKTVRLHDYIQVIEETCTAIHQLAERLNENFMLFVMGSGKNGKSTLINALLGQQAAAEDFLPKTWKIDVFHDADLDVSCTLTFKDGSCRSMTAGEAQAYIEGEEQKRKDSERAIRQELREFKKKKVPLEVLEEKQRELRKYGLYQSQVIEASWPVGHSDILGHYRLVDTPGLRQELDDMIVASAEEYFSKADGVIWILPGDKIASAGDHTELRRLCEKYEKHPDNIIAVVNRMDIVRQNGQDPDDVLAEARRFYGDLFTEIVPISAREARQAEDMLHQDGISKTERQEAEDLLERSNLPALLRLLNRTLFADALDIQIRSKLRGCRDLLDHIRQEAGQASLLLAEVSGQREAKIAAWNKDSSEILDRLKQDLETFQDQEAKRIHREAGRVEDELWDMETDYRNEYILEQIICPESLERRLHELVEAHSRQLMDLYRRHLQKAPFKEFPSLKEDEMTVCLNQQGVIGKANLSDDLSGQGSAQLALGGALAIGAAALLGPVGLIFAGLAATDVGKSVAKFLSRTFGSSMADKIQRRFEDQMDDVRKKLEREYQDYIEKSGGSIDSLRESTYAELYGPSGQTQAITGHLQTLDGLGRLQVIPLRVQDIIFSH